MQFFGIQYVGSTIMHIETHISLLNRVLPAKLFSQVEPGPSLDAGELPRLAFLTKTIHLLITISITVLPLIKNL